MCLRQVIMQSGKSNATLCKQCSNMDAWKWFQIFKFKNSVYTLLSIAGLLSWSGNSNEQDSYQRSNRGWISCTSFWAGIACWLKSRTNPGRSSGRSSLSSVNFVCWLLLGVRSTPVLPQCRVKDPGHSAKSAGGRLHQNTHAPWTQRSRSGLTMPLSRHTVAAFQETESQVVSARWATVDWSWPKQWN